MNMAIRIEHDLSDASKCFIREVVSGLASNHPQLMQEISNMALDISKLQAAVTRDTDVTSSVVTLIQGMVEQLKSTVGSADTVAEAQRAIDDFAAQVNANTDMLAAAVPANTPATDSGSATGDSSAQPADQTSGQPESGAQVPVEGNSQGAQQTDPQNTTF